MFTCYLTDLLKGIFSGVIQVNLLSDKAKGNHFNPQIFEQEQRDQNAMVSASTPHEHKTFHPTNNLAHEAWQNLLQCRICKVSLIEGIGL
jgi:hypothetical protein